MSEADTPPDKPEDKPEDKPGDKPTDTFTIEVKGLESVDEEIRKEIESKFTELSKSSNDTIEALTKQINDLTKKVSKAEQKSEETAKEALLDQLKKANYDPEGFKNLDLKSLQTVVKGLAKTNTGIIIPNQKGDQDLKDKGPITYVHNMKTGKREPFYK